MANAVAEQEMLTEKIRQLSARGAEMEDEVAIWVDIAAELKANFTK